MRELYQRLCADGFEPWLDEEGLLPGQDWQGAIRKAVRNSDVVIVCLSKGSINKAGYVQKEIKFALDVADEQPEDTIFLIPVKLEEREVPERLSRWQWVNHNDPNGYARLLKALRARIGSLGAAIASIPSSSAQQPAAASSSSGTSNINGGVSIAGDARIGNDTVGRDKIIQADTYIEHATIIQSSTQNAQSIVTPPAQRIANVQTWGGVEFVRIPAGKFLMGSKDDNSLAGDAEKPQHTVGFRMTTGLRVTL